MPDTERTKHAIRLYESIQAVRGNWDSSFRDIARFCYPRKASFGGTIAQAQNLNLRLHDGTAQRAASMLAAALHTMIAPMNQPWFYINAKSRLDSENWQVKVWCQEVTRIVSDIILGTNFHSQFHEHLLDFVVLGNGVMYMEEDPQWVVRFSNRPLSECMFAENYRGDIDIVARKFEMTIRQVIQQFPRENIDEKYFKMNDNEMGENNRITVLHIVYPRDDEATYFRFNSDYIDLTTRKTLLEGSSKGFPYLVSRFERASGETYGRGPGWHALPDVQQLNILQKHSARAVQKATDPPFMLPDRLFVSPLDLGPGKPNYYRRTGNTAVSTDVQPFPVGGKFEIAQGEKQELRDAVNKAFYVDQLNLPMLDRMTATEVTERMLTKNYVLSPILGQMQADVLNRIIVRTYMYALRAGRIPPPPAMLQGRGSLAIQYTSPLSKIQRYNEMRGFQQALNAAAPMIQADPTILKSVDGNELFRWMLDICGGPLQIVKSPEQEAADKRAEQEAKMQEAQAGMGPQALQSLAGSIKDVAQAGKFSAEAMNMGAATPSITQ